MSYFHVSEVYSARERNGIYIPRERYFEEEAEKKVRHIRMPCVRVNLMGSIGSWTVRFCP